MKQSYRAISAVLVLAAVLLSACGAGAVQGAGSKVQADVIVTGVIESMNGSQWIVDGRTFTVEPSVVRDGPFAVGDTVKVEGNAQADGTVLVTRVEPPTAEDLATFDDNSNAANTNASSSNDDNSNNANTNDANTNDDNSNTANTNDDNSNDDNSNDDNSNDDNSNDSGGNDNSNDDNSNEDDSNDDNSNDSGQDDSNSNDDNSNGG